MLVIPIQTVGQPIPENQWFPTPNGSYAWRYNNGFTLVATIVDVCDPEIGKYDNSASLFILDEDKKVIGQLVLTSRLTNNGSVPADAWKLIPYYGEGGEEQAGHIEITNPEGAEPAKIEVSAELGKFLGAIETELSISFKLTDDQGKINPSIDEKTVCLKFSPETKPDRKGRMELIRWYRYTRQWYRQKFRSMDK